MRTRLFLALLGLGLVGAAAQQPEPKAQPAPRCESEMTEVHRLIAETPTKTMTGAHAEALLEQVERACKENNEVVAMAGIEQIKAIIETQRKSAG